MLVQSKKSAKAVAAAVRKAAAQAEAAAWLEANKGWDEGMRPIKVEYAGRAAKARNVAGWSDLPWWRMDGKKVGARAPSMEQRKERRAKRPSRGCWGEQIGKPMELPAIRQVEVPLEVQLRLLREGLGEYWEMQRVLRMPFGQKLEKSTWVLGEREMSAVLWAGIVRCRQKKLYVNKKEAQCRPRRGWQRECRLQVEHSQWSLDVPYGAEVNVQELAQGRIRPVSFDGFEKVLEANGDEVSWEPSSPNQKSHLDVMADQEECLWRMEVLSAKQERAVLAKVEGLGLKEIGKELKSSHQAVSQLQKKGLAAAKAVRL